MDWKREVLRRLDPVVNLAELGSLMLAERVRTGLVFNPTRQEHRDDPYPLYRTLRERDPVHWCGPAGGWVLSRYEDILAVLSDRSFSADERRWRRFPRVRARSMRAGLQTRQDEEGLSMLRSDPPDHTRLRGLVNKAFTPRAVESLRGRIEIFAHELLDALPAHGSVEAMSQLASPLPVAVIAEMLGVPPEERDRFKAWSDEAVKSLGDQPMAERRKGVAAMEEMGAWLERFVEERRREPRDDLISALVAAEEAGDRLSQKELFSTCVLLLVAGNETTASLVGNALVALLRHPGQLALLREEPKRIPAAIDELLRYDSPVQLTSRFATEDGSLAGRKLRRGDQVVLLLGAANRDPARFEEPDRLDLRRDDVRHLSFGHGTHFCLGAKLARLEAEILLEAILRRLPDLRFADPAAAGNGVAWRNNTVLRGPDRLPLLH